jgi:hypothetical protein
MNPDNRASASGGSDSSSRVNATNMALHNRSSTLIGTPIDDRSPKSRVATSPITPDTTA